MIDTHAHLFDPKIINSIDEIINKSKEINIQAIIIPTVNFETFETTLKLAEKYPAYLFPAFGIHPTELVFDKKFRDNFDTESLTDLIVQSTITNRNQIVAIGETGLDYYWLKKEASLSTLEKQNIKENIKKLFEIQIKIGAEFNLPIIVHLRDIEKSKEVYNDALEIISKHKDCMFQFHSCSGDNEFLRKVLELRNTIVSFTANFTYKGNEFIQDNLIATPISKLVLETDSPYLPPLPQRKYPNTPVNLALIAKQISEIKGIEYSKLIDQTTKNSIQFYQLKIK